MTARSAPRAWDGHTLALAVSDERVLLSPEGAGLVLAMIAAAEQVARRDGIGLSPQLAHLRDVLRLVAVSGDGHADVREEAHLPVSESVMGAGQVAEALGCSARQARRVIASGSLGPARRFGRSWQVDKAEVAAYAAQRRGSA